MAAQSPQPKGHKTRPNRWRLSEGHRDLGCVVLQGSAQSLEQTKPYPGPRRCLISSCPPNCKSHPLWRASPSPSASPHHRILAMQPASCSGDTEAIPPRSCAQAVLIWALTNSFSPYRYLPLPSQWGRLTETTLSRGARVVSVSLHGL